MTNRAVIWAGVSSRPQVEDKDSLPRQTAEGEALCARQGWQIVARLHVPGATRNYVDLADAIDGLDDDLRRLKLDTPNAYRELAELIAKRQLDVLVCRSRDRLARTDSLIAGIEERLRRIGATVYSMAMPPTGKVSGDFYVSAVERASAQHEIERLRERRVKGMDDRLRRGLILTGPIPFPYNEALVLRGSKMAREAVPDPEKVEAYLWAVDAVLARKQTSEQIGDRLRSRWPDQGFGPPKIRDLLKNPMPVGLIIRRRPVQEYEEGNLVVYNPLESPFWPEIETVLLRRAAADRELSERRLETPRLWLANAGQHEPVVEPEVWLELQRFLDLRTENRRPPSRTRLWSSLLWCARCGASMYANISSKRADQRYYGNYVCSDYLRKRSDCTNPSVPEDVVTEQMVMYLEALASASALVVIPETATLAYDPQRELEKQRAALAERRDRLLMMFETGRIDLDTYDNRVVELNREQLRIQNDLNALAEQRVKEVRAARNVTELAKSKPRTILEGDPAAANRWLREILSKVWVDSRKVMNVEL